MTESSAGEAAPGGTGRRRAGSAHAARRFAARATVSAPDRLTLLLFWTSLVVSTAVLFGQFRPAVVVPLLAVVLGSTWRLMPSRFVATKRDALGAVVALVAAGTWLVVNLQYASRYVLVTRDPGFLTLEGLWLTEHASPELPVSSALEAQDLLAGARSSTDAYFALDGVLHAQGAKLLPGLLALGGWVGGQQAVLAGNLLVGAVGLLAVYGLARRVVGPLWAVLPVVALAASMPMTVFSRAAYTEPLTLCLVFGGLAMSWSAFETRTWWRHALSGAMIGATALARVDGAASVIGLLAGIGIVAAAPLAQRQRSRQQVALAVAAAGALAMVALGYLDLRWHSPGYLMDLGSELTQLILALVATVLAALLIALPRRWDPARRLVLRHRAAWGSAAAVAIGAAAWALVARPWWSPAHHTDVDSAYSAAVVALQALEGLAIEPSRSYDDWSVRWLSWYFGWPMVVLAFAGLAMMARRAVKHRDPRLLVMLAVIGAPSALYLWRVSITPDQVWAMRRLLPVTIPGFLIAATFPLVSIWATRRVWARVIAVLLTLAIAVHPWTTWGSLFTVPEQEGRLGEIDAVCDAIDGDNVLYVQRSGPTNYLATIRSVCDTDTIWVVEPPTASDLARLHEQWSEPGLKVVTFATGGLTWAGDVEPPPLLSTVTRSWTSALSHIPDQVSQETSSVWVAEVDPDGTLVAVPAQVNGIGSIG